MKRIIKEKMIEIINQYESGLSTCKIAELTGYSHVGILKALKRNDITIRDMSHARQIYSFNESYFDIINTEEKAYWLGFICADGYLDYDRKAFQLMLSSKDKNQLNKFLKSIGSNHPIRDYENNGCGASRVYIRNILLFQSLSKFINRNKTYSLRFPNLDTKLIRHFIRGYFDGDGYVYSKKGYQKFSITSNKHFNIALKNILIESLGLKNNKDSIRHKENPNIITITFNGLNNIKKIYFYLYNNSRICMERKKNEFKKAIN